MGPFSYDKGRCVVEKCRYWLDSRHLLVRQRMYHVIDRLVADYGIGYFKFDYDIEVL